MVVKLVEPPLVGCRDVCAATASSRPIDPTSSTVTPMPAHVTCTATVQGVVSQPELNGQTCVLEAFNRRVGRYVCRLRDGRQLRLKPECCEIRCPCLDAAVPCGSSCDERCAARNPLNSVAGKQESPAARLSTCAAAHRSTVLSLSPEQRGAVYPLACFERWQEADHRVCATTATPGGPRSQLVELQRLLGPSASPCMDCGDDSRQYFCFCMNRAVSCEVVRHCSRCGKCFYHRRHLAGQALRCSFCHFRVEEGDESKEVEEELQRRGFWATRDPAMEARAEAAAMSFMG
jgi:hypothetical protein|eukprot:COSAG01_NODE_3281_length_6311_cov_20.464907_6_plen_290_part_00